MKKQFKAGGDSKSWGLVFSAGPQSHHSLKADISGSPGRPRVTGSDPAGGQSFAKQQRPGRGGGAFKNTPQNVASLENSPRLPLHGMTATFRAGPSSAGFTHLLLLPAGFCFRIT